MLIVLLLLYVGTQLASSLMMSSPMMDKQQRRLMMFLPLVFVVIVINFPAGLLVYWITTNLWTMGQQYTVRRLIGTPPPLVATAGAAHPGTAQEVAAVAAARAIRAAAARHPRPTTQARTASPTVVEAVAASPG